ncbi:hypothetical protein BDN70DRAFT_918650 [Pholiota conissans]|uniref:Uncharacterized protein n=1 Tax=Pholiota conissans TaxID=109636 RepID=A0A9P6D514_9AGAR|nr:hypothetical protein BDN70DRAFT_918650 [Pholiota conissans]
MLTKVPPLDRDDDEWPSMHQDQTWSELVYLESHLVSNEWERVVINYEVNPRIYDSGHMLIVAYIPNWDDPTAFENVLLDYNPPPGVEPLKEVFTETNFSKLETMNGILTSSVTEAVDDIIHYLPIPSHLSHICTVPITEIRKVRMVCMDVDKVRWNGRTFAFKKTGFAIRLTSSASRL